jgi:hypothetical protein
LVGGVIGGLVCGGLFFFFQFLGFLGAVDFREDFADQRGGMASTAENML